LIPRPICVANSPAPEQDCPLVDEHCRPSAFTFIRTLKGTSLKVLGGTLNCSEFLIVLNFAFDLHHASAMTLIRFGGPRCSVDRREFLHGRPPVTLRSRAFEILCVLTTAKGETVGKASRWRRPIDSRTRRSRSS